MKEFLGDIDLFGQNFLKDITGKYKMAKGGCLLL